MSETSLERMWVEPNTETIESRITELEYRNEIRTSSQRLLEASLLVEPTFFYPAIITGQSAGLECAFGKEQWANYLEARLHTKMHSGPLTLDFVLDVYRSLLGRSDRNDVIQDTKFEEGHLGIGANGPRPMTLTERQIANIDANPYTEWLPVVEPSSNTDDYRRSLSAIHPIAPYLLGKHGFAVTDRSSKLGYINYALKNKDEKLRVLTEIVDQYNREAALPHDPDQLAAWLQRGIVSLHIH